MTRHKNPNFIRLAVSSFSKFEKAAANYFDTELSILYRFCLCMMTKTLKKELKLRGAYSTIMRNAPSNS